MSWIQTASGHRFDLLAPQLEQIHIEDIAAALANLCRFGGHTNAFYSVAQHSVLASFVAPADIRLEALLHDASEAYVGDMVSPLKQELPQYTAIERGIKARIWEKFGLRFGVSDAIRKADLVMLATERRDLMSEQATRWPILDHVTPAKFTIDPWPPARGRHAFLSRFDALQKAREQRMTA
jgi:uncharacterized protein